MKLMKKSDLILVLNEIDTDKTISINDLICLYEAFGDDYVIKDGKLVKVYENEAMAALRKEHNS